MIRISSSFSELDYYEDQWNLAAGNSKTPFLSFDWFKCCEHSIAKNNNLIISIHTDTPDDRLISAIPLCQRNKILNYCSYEILGASMLHEPSDFIYIDNDALIQLIEQLGNLRRPVILQRMPFETPHKLAVKTKALKYLLVTEKTVTGSQYIDLEADVPTFESRLSSRRKYDLKRAWKKAEKQGRIIIDIINPGINNVYDLLDTAFEIENSGWKGHNGSSILSRPELEKFFRCYLEKSAEQDKLTIGFLKINDKVVAMQIAVKENNQLWLLKIGHREYYSNISPGIILTHEMIKYAIVSGLKRFEFLGSTESWLNFWAPQEHRYKVYALYPINISGIAHLAIDTISRLVNKLKIK